MKAYLVFTFKSFSSSAAETCDISNAFRTASASKYGTVTSGTFKEQCDAMVLAQEIKVSIGIFLIFEESPNELLDATKIKGFQERKRIIKNIFHRIHIGFKSFSYLYSLLEK